MFKKTLFSDLVVINAPREWVWSVLLDLPRYGEWNPFTYRVDTTLDIGDPVDLYVRMPIRGDRMQKEYVRIVESPSTLAWGMHMGSRLLLKAQRQQQLDAIDKTRCTYQTWDAFSGLLTPVVTGLFGADIVNGFNAMAYALKQRAEASWQGPTAVSSPASTPDRNQARDSVSSFS